MNKLGYVGIIGVLLMCGGCANEEENETELQLRQEELSDQKVTNRHESDEPNPMTDDSVNQDLVDGNKVSDAETERFRSYLSVGDTFIIKDKTGEVNVWETTLKGYELIEAQVNPAQDIIMLYFEHNFLAIDETGNLSQANPLNITATFNGKELIEQTEVNDATNQFENEADYVYYFNEDPSIPTCSRSFVTAGEVTSCYAYFKYEGAGDYIIHFSDGKGGTFDYLVNLLEGKE